MENELPPLLTEAEVREIQKNEFLIEWRMTMRNCSEIGQEADSIKSRLVALKEEAAVAGYDKAHETLNKLLREVARLNGFG